MVSREIKEKIIAELKNLPVCISNNDETEWTVRCPYCGDSRTESHGHLGVLIDRENDAVPMVYRCLKCEASGLVDASFLNDIGVTLYGSEANELKKANRKAARYNRFTNTYVPNADIPIWEDTALNREKLKYVSDRIGHEFTLEEAHDLRFILDWNHFMNLNKIEHFDNMQDFMIRALQNHYVGFLCSNNNVINGRLIHPGAEYKEGKQYRRYMKATINSRIKTPYSFYAIPNKLDPMINQTLHVHIAEGVFDILSIYYNIPHTESGQHIFFASCGFGPMTIIQYLVYNGLGYEIVLHLYCDNDKSDYEEKLVILKHRSLVPWLDSVWFHRNQFDGEKDYGVTKDRIVDSRCKFRF